MMDRAIISREEIFQIFQEVIYDQEGSVTLREFVEQTGIPESQIRKHFGSWTALLKAHGGTGEQPGHKRHAEEDLWEAYHQLVAKFGRFPTHGEIDRHSPFSSKTYYSRFGSQARVKAGYRLWLQRQQAARDSSQPQSEEQYQPSQAGHDLVWLRNQWRRVRITFELRSSEFRGRSAHEWDLLVVLEHDWLACPVKVLRLCDLLPETRDIQPGTPAPLDDEPTRAELYGRMPWEED